MELNGKVTNPGEMRTRITLQARTVSEDAGGFETPTWSTIATVWGRWISAHGPEIFSSSTIEAERSATVLIRFRNDIDETCGVLLNTELYEITSIDNIRMKNEYLELRVRKMRPG